MAFPMHRGHSRVLLAARLVRAGCVMRRKSKRKDLTRVALGFAIGAALIFNIKDAFPRRVVLEPDNVAALAALVAVVCLVSSTLGVRAALRVDPASALGG